MHNTIRTKTFFLCSVGCVASSRRSGLYVAQLWLIEISVAYGANGISKSHLVFVNSVYLCAD